MGEFPLSLVEELMQNLETFREWLDKGGSIIRDANYLYIVLR